MAGQQHGEADWVARLADEVIERADARAAAGDTPVVVHAADATSPEVLSELDGRVDVVVTNPPYIPLTDTLPPETAHEPATALFGGDDGLEVIRPLARVAARLLAPGGLLAVEHDDAGGAGVASVLEATGCFGTVERHTDLAGRPRFVTATARGTRRDTARGGATGREQNRHDYDDDTVAEVDPTVQKGIAR